jgi:hypothetical protein
MKRTPMSITRAVSNRKLIFAMIRGHNLPTTMHLKRITKANPSPIVNELNLEAHSKPRGKA